MKRDYARKKIRSHSPYARSYWKWWLGIVVLFGGFTLGLVYFGKHYLTPTSRISSAAPKFKTDIPLKFQRHPRFDFYTPAGKAVKVDR